MLVTTVRVYAKFYNGYRGTQNSRIILYVKMMRRLDDDDQ